MVPNMIPQFGPVTYTKLSLICLHGTKYSIIAWPWVFRVESCLWMHSGFLEPNSAFWCQMHFRILCLSVLFVPMLYLKDPHTRNDMIHPELLLTVGVIHWNKAAWVLATQKQEELCQQ